MIHNLLLELVVLPNVLALALHQVNYFGWMDHGNILCTRLFSFQKLGLIDKLILEHVGLPHVLVLTVYLVNLLGWMGKGYHSRYLATLLLKVRVN